MKAGLGMSFGIQRGMRVVVAAVGGGTGLNRLRPRRLLHLGTMLKYIEGGPGRGASGVIEMSVMV